jgi:chemotaxis protein methyltransferase CheR
VTAIHPDNYRFLQEHIRRQSGIVLDDNKHYLIEARLLPVARDYGLKTLDDLCVKLRMLADISLQRKVVEAMTTNETYFFREPSHFAVLRSHLVPAFQRLRRPEQKLSLWSAAASTGQEAYSLAILLSEMGLGHSDVRIVGTDISEAVLQRASSGIYNQVEIDRGLPPHLRAKYCTQRDNETWEIKPAIRRMTHFQILDLRYNMRALGQFDVVFCRNVLIYFDSLTKSRIVEDIRSVLNPGGYLFLGGSEVSLNICPGFARLTMDEASFFQAT